VLRILNKLAPKPLETDALLDLATRLGSDVPFLASDFVMALAWGRGEKLLRVPPLPPRDVQLFIPPFGIDTSEAYALLDASRTTGSHLVPELTPEMFADWDSAAKRSVNDFEAVIRPRWPAIESLMARGDRHGLFYRMSGSGSTVFKVPGVYTRFMENRADLPPLEVPEGTKVIVTRTAESVVPVELLD